LQGKGVFKEGICGLTTGNSRKKTVETRRRGGAAKKLDVKVSGGGPRRVVGKPPCQGPQGIQSGC